MKPPPAPTESQPSPPASQPSPQHPSGGEPARPSGLGEHPPAQPPAIGAPPIALASPWLLTSAWCFCFGWAYLYTALPDRAFRTYHRTKPKTLAKTLPIKLAIKLTITLTIKLTITLTALCNYAQLSTPNQATIFSTLCHLKKNCKYMGYSRTWARAKPAPSTERSEVAERSGAG